MYYVYIMYYVHIIIMYYVFLFIMHFRVSEVIKKNF